MTTDKKVEWCWLRGQWHLGHLAWTNVVETFHSEQFEQSCAVLLEDVTYCASKDIHVNGSLTTLFGLRHSVIQITCCITRGAHVEFNKLCVSPLFVLSISLMYQRKMDHFDIPNIWRHLYNICMKTQAKNHYKLLMVYSIIYN
jgi:hypothetical protein